MKAGPNVFRARCREGEGRATAPMPERLFNHGMPPQRIRTFLVLFALALTLPLIGLAVLAFNQLASLDEAETERRVLRVAQSLVDDIDRELDRATVTLETL